MTEEGGGCPGIIVIYDYKPQYGGWEINLDPLEEQQGYLTYTLASFFLLPLKFIILAVFVLFSFKSLLPDIDMAVTRSTDHPFL